MSEITKALRDRRQNVWKQAVEIAERSASENRTMSAEEQGQWDGWNAELDALDKRIKSALDVEQRAKETNDLFDRISKQPDTGVGGGSPSAKRKDSPEAAELRAWMMGGGRGNARDGSNGYEYHPTGRPAAFTNDAEQRVLSKLTAGAGANLVPVSFYDRLMAHLVEVSGILQAGPTIINTDSGEALTVPKTTTHPVAALVAEAGTLAASDPVFAQGSLGAYKYGIIIQLSRELIADTGVDVEGYLAMSAGRALGNALGAHLATGTGTAQPTGIVTSATLGVTGPTGAAGGLGATSATLNQGADLLFDLYYSVIAPYRASKSCAWLTRDANMAAIRKIKATTGQEKLAA